MFIKKGSILEIHHCRKGRFTAIAFEDFDTDKKTFYPVKTTMEVSGLVNEWYVGEKIPCKNCFCHVRVIRAGS